jgi:hypothetical protein
LEAALIRPSSLAAMVLLVTASSAGAEGSRPFVRARLNPPAPATIVVGQGVSLTVSVFAPTFFMTAPVWPDPVDIPNAIGRLEPAPAVNSYETIGGQSFEVISREYRVYPLAAGTITIPAIALTVSYALEGGRSSPPTTLVSSPVAFGVEGPPRIARGVEVIWASSFGLIDRFDQALEDPTVADAATPTTTMTAAGSSSALLPRADAQTPSPSAAPPPQVVPQVDLLDVWHQFRNKPTQPDKRPEAQGVMIAAAPIIGWNPTFGMTFGAAGQLAFVKGDPQTTRISSTVASLSYSTKHQVLFNARFDIFTQDDRLFIEGDNRIYSSGQTIYGLGTDTPSSVGIDADYNFVRLHDTVSRNVGHDVYLGAGLAFDSYTNIRPATASAAEWSSSPFVTYSSQHDLPLDSQQSGGVTINVAIDRRVGEIDARRGWLVSAFYRLSFDGLLGGDSNWQLLHLEGRAYVPLAGRPPAGSRVPARHRLAFWTFSDLTTNGTPPYFDLPETVSDNYARSSRGYRQGRYRGERLVYGEVEYRGMLTANGLFGMVAFANTATLTNLETGEHLFDSFAPAAGAGLRVLFNKRSRTNFCIDFAVGKEGSRGLYFAIQDAF